MMKNNKAVLISILWILCIIIIIALLFKEDDNKIENINAYIEKNYKLKVVSDKLFWYPDVPQNSLADFIIPKKIIFLASPSRDKNINHVDLYWQDIKVFNNYLIETDKPVKLTPTPNAREVALNCFENYCIFGSEVMGRIQSLNLFDLNGEKNFQGFSLIQKWMQKISYYQETATFSGIKKIVYFLKKSYSKVNLQNINNQEVNIKLFDSHNTEDHIKISLSNSVNLNDATNNILSARYAPPLTKEFIIWAVDTVRDISWIGPAPITWLEEHVFAIGDYYRRTRYNLFESETKIAKNDDPELVDLNKLLSTTDKIIWPPPRAHSVFLDYEPGEGVWAAPRYAFIRKIENAPPAFFTTYVRPDTERPYVKTYAVAIDLRQLELRMIAGLEDPVSTTGAQGDGKIPNDPDTISRLVAAFNGAFKTEHGSFGMLVNRKIFLPPLNGAATLATFNDGITRFGTWSWGEKIPVDLISLRQNMEPLVVDGVINPTRRVYWGFTPEGIEVMQTVRSGICMTPQGQLIYLWGEDLNAQVLGKAMINSGCTYGMHLDMNPFNASFIFYRAEPGQREIQWSLLANKMMYPPKRYLRGAPKDFFYLLLKRQLPDIPAVEGIQWKSGHIKQPEPYFVPAIWTGQFENNGDKAQLMAIDLSRVSFGFTFGDDEPDWGLSGWRKNKLDDESFSKILGFIPLGIGSKTAKRGVIGEGNILIPSENEKPWIVYNDKNNIQLMESLPDIEKEILFAVQGEWLIHNSNQIDSKCNNNISNYSALGIDKNNRYIVYGESLKIDFLAKTFINLGLQDALLLCRGGETDDNIFNSVVLTKNNSNFIPSDISGKNVNLQVSYPQSNMYIFNNDIIYWGERLDIDHGGGGEPKRLSLAKKRR